MKESGPAEDFYLSEEAKNVPIGLVLFAGDGADIRFDFESLKSNLLNAGVAVGFVLFEEGQEPVILDLQRTVLIACDAQSVKESKKSGFKTIALVEGDHEDKFKKASADYFISDLEKFRLTTVGRMTETK